MVISGRMKPDVSRNTEDAAPAAEAIRGRKNSVPRMDAIILLQFISSVMDAASWRVYESNLSGCESVPATIKL